MLIEEPILLCVLRFKDGASVGCPPDEGVSGRTGELVGARPQSLQLLVQIKRRSSKLMIMTGRCILQRLQAVLAFWQEGTHTMLHALSRAKSADEEGTLLHAPGLWYDHRGSQTQTISLQPLPRYPVTAALLVGRSPSFSPRGSVLATRLMKTCTNMRKPTRPLEGRTFTLISTLD